MNKEGPILIVRSHAIQRYMERILGLKAEEVKTAVSDLLKVDAMRRIIRAAIRNAPNKIVEANGFTRYENGGTMFMVSTKFEVVTCYMANERQKDRILKKTQAPPPKTRARVHRQRGTNMTRFASAYFAPLVTAPVMIDAPGRYQTRCGETVSVEASSSKHDFGCVGHYPNGIAEKWHKSGRIFSDRETRNDIIAKL